MGDVAVAEKEKEEVVTTHISDLSFSLAILTAFSGGRGKEVEEEEELSSE